jgi:hypothetical protein
MWSPRVIALAGVIALIGSPGCGAFKRVSECEAVIETVNGSLAELHPQVPDAGLDSSAYGRIAGGYEALGKRLDELAPSDAALLKAIAGYRDITDRAAKHSRAYSEALAADAGSRKQRNERNARLARIRSQAQADMTREAQVVKKINAVCHPQ